MHKLVYERARYLQRQERYDFVPWDETHGIRDDEFEKDVHALLLIEPPHIPVGVTSFSWKKWSNRPRGWHLNFIWIAGTWRRKGVFRGAGHHGCKPTALLPLSRRGVGTWNPSWLQ